MITKNDIVVRYTRDGVYLSVKTDKGDYGQYYNTFDKTTPSFQPDLDSALERFVAFYNKFEN